MRGWKHFAFDLPWLFIGGFDPVGGTLFGPGYPGYPGALLPEGAAELTGGGGISGPL